MLSPKSVKPFYLLEKTRYSNMVRILKYMYMNTYFKCVMQCSKLVRTDMLPCWMKENIQSESAVRFGPPRLRVSQVGAVTDEGE